MIKNKKVNLIILFVLFSLIIVNIAYSDLYLNSQSGSVYLNTSNTARIQITSGGNLVGIGLLNASIPGNLSVGGNFSVNGNNLFVDTTNARVGVGTTVPVSPLTIGSYPTAVAANTYISADTVGQGQTFRVGWQATPSRVEVRSTNVDETAFTALAVEGSTLLLNVRSGGNVGIGTNAPQNILHVNGTGFLVTNTTGSANVFVFNATTGFVGINTLTPLNELTVIGSVSTFGTLNATKINATTILQGGNAVQLSKDFNLENISNYTQYQVRADAFNNVNLTSFFGNASINNSLLRETNQSFFNQFARSADFNLGNISNNTLKLGDNASLSLWNNTNGNTFLRSINDKVGIGTPVPNNRLTIVGSDADSSLATPGLLHLNLTDNYNNTLLPLLTLDRMLVNPNNVSTGAGQPSNLGLGILFRATNNDSEIINVSLINATLVNGFNGTEASALSFSTITNGGQLTPKLVLNGSDVFIAPSGGNVGIGITAPSALLHVKGGNMVLDNSGGTIDFRDGGGNSKYFLRIVNSNNDLEISDRTGAGATTMTWKSGGNVGIGTTGPQNKLEVIGAATFAGGVNASSLNVTGFSITDDSLVTLSDGSKKKIKNIKAGEQVLTLDEKTGKLVPRKVNALLDHGIKPIYEMTTEDGRAINTTGEHPYLVKLYNKEECDKYSGDVWNKEVDEFNGYCTRWVQVSEFKEKGKITVPKVYYHYSSKNISTNSRVEYTLTSSCFLKSFSLDQIAQLRCKANAKYGTSLLCGANLSALDCISSGNSYIGNTSILFLRISNTSITSGSEVPQILANVPMFLLNSSIKYGNATSLNLSTKNKSFVLPLPIIAANKAVASTTSSIYLPLYLLATAEEILSVNSLATLSDTLTLDENALSFFNSSVLSNIALVATSDQSNLNSFIVLSSSSGKDIVIAPILNNKEIDIYKTFELKGDEIAVPDYSTGTIKWERIASINILEPQHVYDLSIEGTRNFIANDIVAHNTYLATSSGNVGIGTISPQNTLHVNGTGFLITNTTGATNVFVYNATTGFVGINTLSSVNELTVIGSVSTFGTLNATSINATTLTVNGQGTVYGSFNATNINASRILSPIINGIDNGSFLVTSNISNIGESRAHIRNYFVLTNESKDLGNATVVPDVVWITRDFEGDTIATDLAILGTETISTVDPNEFGIRNYASTATSTTDTGVSLGGTTVTTSSIYNASKLRKFQARLRLVDGSNKRAAFGLISTSTTQNLANWNNGIFFNFTTNGNLFASACKENTCTVLDTGHGYNMTNFTTLEIRTDTLGSLAEFFINKTLVATITTNLPTNRSVSWIGAWVENMDTIADNIRVDYLHLEIKRG